MNALATLQAVGLQIEPLPGGQLRVGPATRLTDDLRALIRKNKAAIWQELTAQPPPKPCPACGGRVFWRRLGGVWVCEHCHPPAPPVAAEIVVPGPRNCLDCGQPITSGLFCSACWRKELTSEKECTNNRG